MTEAVELAEILERSRAWLSTAGGRPSASLRHSLQSLLGVWACDRALGEESGSEELGTLVEAALTKLDHDVGAGSFDPYSYDPKLLLLSLRVFEREAHEPAAMRMFADSIADALASLPRIPPAHAGVAAVLYQLDYPGISASAVDPPDEPDVDTLLRGGPDAVRAACSSVAAATHFGAWRIDAPSFDALRRALPIVFLQSLRSYDLDSAAMLLRTSRYLRMRRMRRIEEGIAFLVDQQRPDGRFGFFGVETSALQQSEDLPGFDEVLTLYLPVTSTCAWALAEVMSDRCLLFERPRGRRRAVPELQLSS
jgi:hypothetical protein